MHCNGLGRIENSQYVNGSKIPLALVLGYVEAFSDVLLFFEILKLAVCEELKD